MSSARNLRGKPLIQDDRVERCVVSDQALGVEPAQMPGAHAACANPGARRHYDPPGTVGGVGRNDGAEIENADGQALQGLAIGGTDRSHVRALLPVSDHRSCRLSRRRGRR
jgi:hypothetical protein